MNIKFKCPECDTIMGLEEEQHVCPNCDNTLTIAETETLFDQGEIVGIMNEDEDVNTDDDTVVEDDDNLEEGYQGFTNQETWGVALTLQNDYKLFSEAMVLGKQDKLSEESVQKLVESAQAKGGFEDVDLADIEWSEIVEDFEDEISEAKEISEDLVGALSGAEELSEETKAKITTIFESAVAVKTNGYAAKLVQEYDEQLEVARTEIQESVEEEVDGYLNKVVAEWTKDNELAIEQGIRTEITESFLGGLRNLFAEHFMDIPEERYDVLEDLANKVGDLEEAVKEANLEKETLEESIMQMKKDTILSDVSEGLADTDKERLTDLSKSVNYESDEKYKSDIKTLKESFIDSKKSSSSTLSEEETIVEDDLTEINDDNDNAGEKDTLIQAAAKLLASTNK